MMEKNIHQIWIGKYPMPEKERKFSTEIQEKLKEQNPDYKYFLWTNENIPEFPDKFQEVWNYFETQKDYAFQADILRVYVVYQFGGLYLDMDHRWINGIYDLGLEHFDAFFCGHWGDDYTIPNGSFGGTAKNSLMEFLYNNISLPCGWYGPSWMGDTVHEYYGLGREINHDDFKTRLSAINILYMRYSLFYEIYFRHEASYNWSCENKKRFEKEFLQ